VDGPIQQPSKSLSLLGWVQLIATSQAGRIVLLRTIINGIIGVIFSLTLYSWMHRIPYFVLVLVLGFYLYFGCLFAFEVGAAVPACLLGLQSQRQFNMPYLADSLVDFWGRRWNLLVNNLLRVSVYEPVLGFLSRGEKSKKWERAVSTAATFLVSGLMHELLICYETRTWPTWGMTTFFVLNGLGAILEAFVQPRKFLRLPRIVTWAYTKFFVYFTAYWFFMPSILHSGLLS
jgi:D-alanyl-lipoteichoic acid acyltransferase DltB (MBOAT superfamily)